MSDPAPDTAVKPTRSVAVGGGVSVILLTGMAAMAKLYQEGGGVLTLGLVLVATVLGAMVLARFIARHGHEIGEARFDTTPKDPPRH